jgi:hypothetical protein
VESEDYHAMWRNRASRNRSSFSPVAIAKAQDTVAQDDVRPQFLVGDVTHLDALSGPFDISFDVG